MNHFVHHPVNDEETAPKRETIRNRGEKMEAWRNETKQRTKGKESEEGKRWNGCEGIAKRQVESKTGKGKKAISREGKLNSGEYDRNHALAERNLSPKIIIPLLLTLALCRVRSKRLYNPDVFTTIPTMV